MFENKRGVFALVGVCAAVSIPFAVAGSAQAAPGPSTASPQILTIPKINPKLLDLGTGKCLDEATETIGDRLPKLQLWSCGGNEEQRWSLQEYPLWSGGSYGLKNEMTSQCVSSYGDGIPASVDICTGGYDKSYNIFWHDTTGAGWYMFQDPYTKLCLTPLDGRSSNGTVITEESCDYSLQSKYQQWQVDPDGATGAPWSP